MFTARARAAGLALALAACLALGALATAADATTASGSPGLKAATAPVVTKVIGKGTPASCTQTALFNAVRTGGNISFNCGPKPVTITITKTLRTCNTHNCKPAWEGGKTLTAMTLDGGGKVTLSGGGKLGIYYANSCEESFGWITDRCDTQTYLHVTFKNLRFVSGNATKGVPGKASVGGGGGGGAIAMRGNWLTVVNSTFKSNRCITAHSDAGGGAIRVVGMKKTASISNSTFTGNKCANGGAISALNAPVKVTNSTFTSNKATGTGASSGKGGNGGAIYYDGGGSQNVTIAGSTFTSNTAPEGGPMVFYVSTDRTGSLLITGTTGTKNTGQSFYTSPYKPIFFLGKTLSVKTSSIH